MTAVYQRLESLEKIGIKLGLRNIKTILEFLGQPQTAYPSILIAGTNGKGSTGAMLESILTKHGLKTGYYTSPHLIDVKERIQLNRKIISTQQFEKTLGEIFHAVDSLNAIGGLDAPPTYFEILTATAFLLFCHENVDFAVVEVGLGGRFDATNVLIQNLSVITSIDYDHEEFLGKSITQIASEKAGIFKQGVPIVCGPLPSEAAEIMREAAEGFNCKITQFSPSSLADLRLRDGFPIFRYIPWDREIRVNLRGRHQALNAGVAIEACNALRESGIELRNEIIAEGLNEVSWPGRLDLLEKKPPVLLDCAHNPMGVRSLASFLREYGWTDVVALFTAMKDKKISTMLHLIAPRTRHLFLTRIHPLTRCATQEQLEKAAAAENITYEFDESVESALDKARTRASELQLPLVIFGSIYLAGEILKLFSSTPRVNP